jgi:hypothetical protein
MVGRRVVRFIGKVEASRINQRYDQPVAGQQQQQTSLNLDVRLGNYRRVCSGNNEVVVIKMDLNVQQNVQIHLSKLFRQSQ